MKVRIAIAVVAVLVLLTAAMTVPHFWQPPNTSEASEKKDDEEQLKNGMVTLDEQKLASLELKVEPAGVHPLQMFHVVPGRIRYDEAHHVEIRAAANVILIQVRVTPGDRVAKDQVLGVVSSPEVAVARTDVHHGEENWQL